MNKLELLVITNLKIVVIYINLFKCESVVVFFAKTTQIIKNNLLPVLTEVDSNI